MLVQFIWSNERKTCLLLCKDIFTPTVATTMHSTGVEKGGITRVSETLETVIILTSETETCSEQGEDSSLETSRSCPFLSNAVTGGKCHQHDLVRRQPLRSWMAAGSSNYLLKSADSTAGSVP